jgi:hypothetical protein
MSPTTTTSAPSRSRPRSRVRDPNPVVEPPGSARFERRSRPARGSSASTAVRTAPVLASGQSSHRVLAVISGVAAVVFLGALAS